MAEALCRLAEQLHQEEQLKEKDKHKADTLLKQAQLEEAERHRKADEALQRAECVRQRRALKVIAITSLCCAYAAHHQAASRKYPVLHVVDVSAEV